MDNSFEEQEEPTPHTGIVTAQPGEIREADTFNILVASDIHLGYCENDPVRENDSFNTFEEILQIANEQQVDFLLLGGDLFHENKPTPNVLRQTTDLLSKYCLGDRPVAFQYVGEPARDFPNQTDPEVNFYNANINIGLPVFTIHGDHDGPIGATKTSAVDQFAAAKLLNHFGQWDNLNSVTVSPVLLVKGETKLALYGLGHLKDDRLKRLMQDKKVKFVGPEEGEGWFNLFVLHQNRVKHGSKSYIPESYIPGFVDLVVWGHEHECRLKMGEIVTGVEGAEGLPKTWICQPGSSVATSLEADEAEEKHVALLQINGRKFRIEPIKLKTVRPFITTDLMATEILEGMPKNAPEKERGRNLEKYVEKVVENLIRDAGDQLTGHDKQPVIPLIRVRIFHDDVNDSFDPIRFSQKYVGRVANDDIILFKKTPMEQEDGAESDTDEIGQVIMDQDDDDLDGRVESIVEAYFANARAQKDEKELLEAIKCAVKKGDDKRISDVIKSQVKKAIEFAIKGKVTEKTYEDAVQEFRERRAEQAEEEKKEADTMLKGIKPKKRKRSDGDEENGSDIANGEDEDGNESSEIIYNVPTAGRSRGGQGSAAIGRESSNSTTSRVRGGRSNAANRDASMSPSPSTSRGCGLGSRGATGGTSNESGGDGKNLEQKSIATLAIPKSPREGKSRYAITFDDDEDDSD